MDRRGQEKRFAEFFVKPGGTVLRIEDEAMIECLQGPGPPAAAEKQQGFGKGLIAEKVPPRGAFFIGKQLEDDDRLGFAAEQEGSHFTRGNSLRSVQDRVRCENICADPFVQSFDSRYRVDDIAYRRVLEMILGADIVQQQEARVQADARRQRAVAMQGVE